VLNHHAMAVISRAGAVGREAALWLDRQFAAYQVAPAGGRGELRSRIIKEAGGLGVRMSNGTFYRRFQAWQAGRVDAMLPPRMRRSPMLHDSAAASALPPGFIGWWRELCIRSQRVTSAAYRELFRELCGGSIIPGYNADWRGILARDYPGYAGDRADCPFRAYGFAPRGWSERNLYALKPAPEALVAGRIGVAAAIEDFGIKIPNTRVGLPFSSVWVMDDRHHDQLVTLTGNIHAQGVVELGAIELLTGYYIYGMKPVMERPDETREMLREDYNRYLVAAVCCVYGYHKAGCLFAGENGTARFPKELCELLERATDGAVRFKAGGLMNSPLVKGLPAGRVGGNPRWKASIESIHNIYKNEMALLGGAKGADPDHSPETLAVDQSEHASLMRVEAALQAHCPELAEVLQSPFPRYHAYRDMVARITQALNARTHHRLEGWDRIGFVRDEYLLDGPDWRPAGALAAMPPAVRDAWLDHVRSDPDRFHRQARISPADAFALSRSKAEAAGELARLPESFVPIILGDKLGQALKVRGNGTMVWRDPFKVDGDQEIAAVVVDEAGHRHKLDAGTEWTVHLSPFDIRAAYISHHDRGYIGQARVLVAGTKWAPDQETIAAVKAAEADMRRTWETIGRRRLADDVDRRVRNAAAMAAVGGADRAGGPATDAMMRGGARVNLEDMVPGHVAGNNEEWADDDAQESALSVVGQCHGGVQDE
jgi:hypothetical protein